MTLRDQAPMILAGSTDSRTIASGLAPGALKGGADSFTAIQWVMIRAERIDDDQAMSSRMRSMATMRTGRPGSYST